MLKIGVITDAHANLPALTAALEALDAEGTDVIVHTGDAIGIGPHPVEVLTTLLERDGIHLLMGNHDAWFAHGLPEPRPEWMSTEEYEHQVWVHAQLAPDLRDAVRKWPYTMSLDLPGLTAQLSHYAYGDLATGFSPIVLDPSPADLDDLFAPLDAELNLYGHHHPRSDLQGRSRHVNPGALGCNVEPRARFAIVDVHDRGGWAVTLRDVRYDWEPIFRDLEQGQVPARETILRIFFGQG
jgi:protein phosphatase